MQMAGQTCTKVGFARFPFPNTTFTDFETLTSPSTRGIKDQARVMVLMVGQLGGYIDIARKTFTVISIVLLVVEAIRYLRSYYRLFD